MSSPTPPVPPNDQGGAPDAVWSAVPDAGETAYLPQTNPQAYPPLAYDTDGYQAPYDAQSFSPQPYDAQSFSPQPYAPQPYAAHPSQPQPYLPTPEAYLSQPVDQSGHGATGYVEPGYPTAYGHPYAAPVDTAAPPQGVNGLAIASLITAFLFPPLGIIFGHLALSQIESRREGGRGLAVAGLVLSYLFTVLIIIAVILMIVFLVVLAKAFDDYRLRTADGDQPVVSQIASSATVSTQSVLSVPMAVSGDGSSHPVWMGAVVRFAGQ